MGEGEEEAGEGGLKRMDEPGFEGRLDQLKFAGRIKGWCRNEFLNTEVGVGFFDGEQYHPSKAEELVCGLESAALDKKLAPKAATKKD